MRNQIDELFNDREKARKDTAREILDELIQSTTCTFDKNEKPIIKLDADLALNICKKYGINYTNKED